MRAGDLVEFRRGNQKPKMCIVLKDVHPAQTGVKVHFPSGTSLGTPVVTIHRSYLKVLNASR